MPSNTPQIAAWRGEFGQIYTERNSLSVEALAELYKKRFGLTRLEMNQRFVGSLERSLRILEIGTNIGLQLECLHRMGFEDLWGIEIQREALRTLKKRLPQIKLSEASAFALPFPDSFFDLIYTSGVLIHIALEDLPVVASEIHRCSRRYIWGFEYWFPEFTSLLYRGKTKLLWKGPYREFFRNHFQDLKIVHTEIFENRDYEGLPPPLMDEMFLLEKI